MLRPIESLAGKKILIYGNGNSLGVFSSFVLSKLPPVHQPEIVAVVDKKVEFNCPEDNLRTVDWLFSVPTLSCHKDNLVVICIGKHELATEIKIQLEKFGYSDVSVMYDFQDFHSAYDKRSFCEIANAISDFEIKHGEFLKKLTADAQSKAVYEAFTKVYSGNSLPKVPQSSVELEQIEPKIGFIKDCQKSDINLLNTGAFNGEILQRILNHNPFLSGTVFLIEPNFNNYNKLVDNVKKVDTSLRVIGCPVAIGSQLKNTTMYGSGVSSTKLSETEDPMCVTEVSIDSLFLNFGLTHLVVDTEGNEYNFIIGAKEQISKNKPNLCISVYHFPTDIVEIPYELNLLCSEYKFYLRNYSGFNTDTLLYAIYDPA